MRKIHLIYDNMDREYINFSYKFTNSHVIFMCIL